jgi:YD repeat-containing protein
MNCRECGLELDPSEEQVNAAVDQILETSLKHAEKKGGVCPLCGHSKEIPYSQRKSILFSLLIACLVLLGGAFIVLRQMQATERASMVEAAITRMNGNSDVVRLLGTPITTESGISGDIRHDETGWREARLTIPVRGPRGKARALIIAGKGNQTWLFTTFEVIFETEHKKLDLISGKISEYDPNAYVEVHAQSAVAPEYSFGIIPEARSDGTFPCVSASVDGGNMVAQTGKCAMAMPMHSGAIDRFEADLRDGNFVLRETDLHINDIFDVPLTRSYRSRDWVSANPVHAFGRNSNHPFDIAPIGSRNPYTYQMLVLEDGGFLYFDRVSKGTGYADAVYLHSETSTPFYKATQSWNGTGWTMKLADGSEIIFPESYNATNLAQGAAIEMRNAKGDRLQLKRDAQRNLQEIKTPHGHWLRFSYDSLSRIQRAEDDAGEWGEYEYTGDGMLMNVVLSSGRQRHYEYQEGLMTRISDEAGRTLVHNTYENSILRQQEFGNGDDYSYEYDWKPGAYYPDKVSVTLPNQKTHEIPVADSVPEFVRNFRPRSQN